MEQNKQKSLSKQETANERIRRHGRLERMKL